VLSSVVTLSVVKAVEPVAVEATDRSLLELLLLIATAPSC